MRAYIQKTVGYGVVVIGISVALSGCVGGYGSEYSYSSPPLPSQPPPVVVGTGNYYYPPPPPHNSRWHRRYPRAHIAPHPPVIVNGGGSNQPHYGPPTTANGDKQPHYGPPTTVNDDKQPHYGPPG